MATNHHHAPPRNGVDPKRLPQRNRWALALGLFGVFGTFALKWNDPVVYIVAGISYLLILIALFFALEEGP